MKKIVITLEMTEEQFSSNLTLAVLAELIADKAKDFGIEHSCEITTNE